MASKVVIVANRAEYDVAQKKYVPRDKVLR